MAQIFIRGIRFESITIEKPDENGDRKLGGHYSLISSAEKVLATNSFGGGYGSQKLEWSPATRKAVDELIRSMNADACATLGLDPS